MAARGRAEVGGRTRDAPDGSGVDRRRRDRAVSAAIKAIRDRQEASGGWSQFARTDPDAYATGLSLYALHVAGVPATDAAYRKGVAFLLGTQYQDGPWLVRTHSFPGAAVFRKRIPVRPASVDLRSGHELGVARHRADLA